MKTYIKPTITVKKIEGTNALMAASGIKVFQDQETEEESIQYVRMKNLWEDDDEEE